MRKCGRMFFVFWLRCMACGILVPRPGIKPVSPALEAWSFNHWTTREVPRPNLSNNVEPEKKEVSDYIYH